jgi:hypothetical protein
MTLSPTPAAAPPQEHLAVSVLAGIETLLGLAHALTPNYADPEDLVHVTGIIGRLSPGRTLGRHRAREVSGSAVSVGDPS